MKPYARWSSAKLLDELLTTVVLGMNQEVSEKHLSSLIDELGRRIDANWGDGR